MSAVADDQLGLLVDLIVAQLPVGPALYPDEVATDEPVEVRVAELIREAALEGVRDELPHSIAVTIDEMDDRRVYATVHVERASQKGIVIGAGGARLKTIGTAARGQIEALLGHPVHIDLHVAVIGEWQRNAKLLDRLGF